VSHKENLHEVYSGDIEEGSVVVKEDPIDQFMQMMEMLKKRSTLALQDDFEGMKIAGFKRNGGKLLLID